MKRTYIISTWIFSLLFLGATAVQAQVPQTLSYQGILTDAAGQALSDGPYTLTFQMYDAAIEGTPLWTETQEVTIVNGLFHAVLGQNTPLDLAFDRPYWVGISVNDGNELEPRLALTSAAYSLNGRAAVAEPENGQSFAIRDANGGTAHIFSPDGNVVHAGQGRFDGGIVISEGDDPVFEDSTQVGEKTQSFQGMPEVGLRGSGARIGVYGFSNSGYGLSGQSQSSIGVYGRSTDSYAVFGTSENGVGVFGLSKSEISPGVEGNARGNGDGVLGVSFGAGNGIYGIASSSSSGHGVLGKADGSGNSNGVRGLSSGTGAGVHGEALAVNGSGVFGTGRGQGVFGTSEEGVGVQGEGPEYGVFGIATEKVGVRGEGPEYGVDGSSDEGAGVRGSGQNFGVVGFASQGSGVAGVSAGGVGGEFTGDPAGLFHGNLFVEGQIKVETVQEDPTQERFLVWSNDDFVRYRTLPAGGGGDGGWVDNGTTTRTTRAVEIHDDQGRPVYRWDPATETFVSGCSGPYAPDGTCTGVPRYSWGTNGVINTDLLLQGRLVVRDEEGNAVFIVNQDGTSFHAGEEEFAGGLTVPIPELGTNRRITLDEFGVFVPFEGAGGITLSHDTGIDVTDEDGNTVFRVNRDGTSFHAGLEEFAGGLAVTGAGNGISFPDGTTQTTAASGAAFDGMLNNVPLVVKDGNGDEVFRVNTDGTSFHAGREVFSGGLEVTNESLLTQVTIDGNGVQLQDVPLVIRDGIEEVVRINADGSSLLGALQTLSLFVAGSAFFQQLVEANEVEMGFGRSNGDFDVGGVLTKQAGSFRIDHPLDPERRYLHHSFVESPDMMNVYNGNVTLDADGAAWVVLPDWFEALNRDFRYQLTPIGAPGPGLYIAEGVDGNRFKIAGGSAGAQVSWQVTGIRHDRFANENRIPVESWKPTATPSENQDR